MDSIFTLNIYVNDVEYCRYVRLWLEKVTIYNLTDTTSAKKLSNGGVLDMYDFMEELYEYDKNKNDEVHWTYKLTVTDSLLSLMEKDTSMLSLFPEYYGNNHTNPQK